MDVAFTIESTNGTDWKAECKDPFLLVEGKSINAVCEKMKEELEKWVIKYFGTTKKVSIVLPTLKAKVKCGIMIRNEKPLTEFEEPLKQDTSDEDVPLDLACECIGCGAPIMVKEGDLKYCDACKYEKQVHANENIEEKTVKPQLPTPPPKKVVAGPCKYLSDGKGVYATGMCEAVSNDPADTPGIRVDKEGACGGDFEKCTFYCARENPFVQTTPVEEEETPAIFGGDEEDEAYPEGSPESYE